MSDLRLVPATEELLRAFYGANLPTSGRALVALRDGRPIGVGGVYANGDHFVFYADITPELRTLPKFLLSAGRRLAEIAKPLGGRVISVASPKVEASHRFLERVGFRRLEGNTYILDRGAA